MSTREQDGRALRRRLLFGWVLGALAVGLAVAGAALWPEYRRIARDHREALLDEASARAEGVGARLAALRAVAGQISSRTTARRILASWNAGESTPEALRARLEPILSDALHHDAGVVGIARLDATAREVVAVGEAVSMDGAASGDGALGWVSEAGRPLRLQIESPIVDRHGRRLGTDVVLFDAEGLAAALVTAPRIGSARTSLLTRSGAVPVGDALGEPAEPALVAIAQRGLAGESFVSDVAAHGETRVAATAPVAGASWAVLLSVPAATAYSGVNGRVAQAAAALAAALLASTLLAYLALRPVAGRILVEVAELEAEVARRREAEARARDLYENAPDMHVAVDAKSGAIVDCNITACNALGFGREELIGRSVLDLYTAESRQDAQEAFEAFQTTGEIRGAEFQLQRADGSTLDVSLNATAVRDDAGRIVGSRAVWRDVTELVRARRALLDHRDVLEQTVAERTEELERSNRELESYAYAVSHDLRAPLRAVHLYLDLLEEDLGEGRTEHADRFASARGSLRRMNELIQGLLEYARVSKGELAVERVELDACVAEVVEGTRAALEEAGGRVEAEPLGAVHGDRTQLARVFQNLIENAIKYRREGVAPVVRIEGRSRDGRREITVADNGIGFAPKHADRIFGVFKQLHAQGRYAGVGIGLAMVRRIVERHGGAIRAESVPGEGSAFHLTLPDAGPGESSVASGGALG